MAVFLFILGLAFMVVGAELLVRGASRLAMMLGISPLVVGLTVVAFGTSAPELAVSFKAALADQASICVGNVVGSNIFNVLFILGLSSLVVPLIVAPQLIRLDVPLMIAASTLALVLGVDGSYSRVDGVIFFAGLVAYVAHAIYASRQTALASSASDAPLEPLAEQGRPLAVRVLIDIGLILGGLVLLVIGANWLVETAVGFAKWFGVSELVIGLTIVSAGTSLPEVVTSLVASIKGERDIAVGNVVGSNIFNILGVLGLSAIVAPSGLEVSNQLLYFDVPVMIIVALITLPIFVTGKIIARGEGVALLSFYVAYTLYLILHATQDSRLLMFSQAMLYGVMPLATFVLLVSLYRHFTKQEIAASST